MSIEVSWYLQGHILYTHNAVSGEVILARNKRILHHMEREGQPPYIHILVDYTGTPTDNYPDNILTFVLKRAQSSEEQNRVRRHILRHPLLGWVVAIGIPNSRIQTTANVIAIKDRFRRHDAATLEEALLFLRQKDPSLIDKL